MKNRGVSDYFAANYKMSKYMSFRMRRKLLLTSFSEISQTNEKKKKSILMEKIDETVKIKFVHD